MFYEDMEIGRVTQLGSTAFTRNSILAYAQRFDPRIATAACEGKPVAALGLHVASAGMRRLVETRIALRAAMAERGETLPELGVSPGIRDLRCCFQCGRATLSLARWIPSPSVRLQSRIVGLPATPFAASISAATTCSLLPASSWLRASRRRDDALPGFVLTRAMSARSFAARWERAPCSTASGDLFSRYGMIALPARLGFCKTRG